MSEPIKSRPMFHSTACERCVFGRGEHAEWCEQNVRPWVVDLMQKRLEDALYEYHEYLYHVTGITTGYDTQEKAKG